MKKLLTGAVLTASLFTTGIVAGTSDYSFVSTHEVQEQINVIGGVIRLDPKKGVYILTDSAHHSVGLEKAYINKKTGALVVVQNARNPVVTTSVDTDETLSGKGITVGLSGGGKESHILFYKDGKRLKLHYPSHYKQVASATSNLWFTSFTK